MNMFLHMGVLLLAYFGGVAAVEVIDVFHGGMENSTCYRIPTIIQLRKSKTLIAFAEQRVTSCGDNGPNNIVLRRSNDGGKSWGDVIVVVEGAERWPKGISNPNPVELEDEVILLSYDTQNNPSAESYGENRRVLSYDAGLTWTNDQKISGWPDSSKGCLPGPSAGLYHPLTKTIYFHCYGRGPTMLYYSRDHAKTWEYAFLQGHSFGECSLAFLSTTARLQ
jgi:sialidase-1